MNIQINEKTVDVGMTVTYEELVQHAGLTGNPSMAVFGKVPGSDLELRKALAPGQSVTFQPGMVVRATVIHTNNA